MPQFISQLIERPIPSSQAFKKSEYQPASNKKQATAATAIAK
jgi:hypothetical protein